MLNNDINEVYFEYKMVKVLVTSVLIAFGMALGATIVVSYIHSKYPIPSPEVALESAKAVEYIRQGYVEKSVPPCSPGWIKYGDKVICDIAK